VQSAAPAPSTERAAGAATPAAAYTIPAAHVEAAGMSMRYPTGRLAVDDVSFTVSPGERVALIGPNGAGKSTLLLSLVRLVEPTGGKAHVLGEEVRRLSARRLRRLRSRVAFVFQRHNLVGRLSAFTNVVHGAQARSASPRLWAAATAPVTVRQEAMAELEAVGLADFAAHRADRLSGGQSQRVAVARAMMQRPELILADEPVASLDPRAAEDVMDLLRARADAAGATFVFTTHNLDHARRHADRLVALKEGRLAFDAATASVSDSLLGALYEGA
jgi:phosphonate transport system ATP-binding protein